VPNHLFVERGVDTARLREDLLDALVVAGETRATYLRQRQARRPRRVPVSDRLAVRSERSCHESGSETR
jgi:hypothetical protein